MFSSHLLRIPRNFRSFSSVAREPIVGGNWKLNAAGGTSKSTVTDFFKSFNQLPLPKCQIYIAPPTVFLDHAASCLSKDTPIQVCGQNVYCETKGAFTGETSAVMMQDIGINWTLIGHSERRDLFHEDDVLLGKKIKHCQEVGMNVVACVGEHKDAREENRTMEVLRPQLDAIVNNVSAWDLMVIAYEPVWAIGTGLVATPEQAQSTCKDIRDYIREKVSSSVADKLRIQYGGSVNKDNVVGLSSKPDIDGFLVGGASLLPETFAPILDAYR